MDDLIEAARARRGSGVIAAADLRDLGLHPDRTRRLIAVGDLVRIRTGAYADAAEWRSMDAAGQHRMLVAATPSVHREGRLVSHLSAAAMHHLPIVGAPPDRVVVSIIGRDGGRRTSHVSVRRAGEATPIETIDGVPCTSLLRTLVDVSATEPLWRSVPMLDDAMRRTGISPEELLEVLDDSRRRRGRRLAQSAIAFADGRSESPGESLSRVRMHELGFMLPELQVAFIIAGRRAVVDFFWRELGLVGEFDGRMKYLRSREVSGLDPADVVYEEKRREDALRALGLRVVRWDWRTALAPTGLAPVLAAAGVPRR